MSSSLNETEIEFFFAALHHFTAWSQKSSAASEDKFVRVMKQRKLETALDNFRMAATNLSTSSDDLRSAKTSLLEALDATNLLENVIKMHEARMSFLNAEVERKSSGNVSYKDKNCYSQVEMQEVVKNLWIGSWHPAVDENLLKRCGVTHICCCINVKPRLEGKGFSYVVLGAEDNPEYEISKHFDESFKFIDNALAKQGTGVLVHCGAGISRAATILAAYLIRKLRIKADDAVSMIQKVRQVARPNNEFVKQLKTFEKQVEELSKQDASDDDDD